jgi:dTDP-4-dehydrorhamnose 3,5-epimerase
MVELSEENKNQFWIPSGFAHGFLSLADETIFSYKCTNLYNKDSESGLLWNDKDLNIQWPIENPIVSEKDIQFTSFSSFKSPF